jgi:FlaA1/EpsC-like NDP-sugar epimerase
VTRILVTGAAGSIGGALVPFLLDEGHDVLATDKGTLDVRDVGQVRAHVVSLKPDLIYHLAGAKHAPEGEEDPLAVTETNVHGTANVLDAARLVGAKVVVSSTCKACDPETVYGASKLIAERLTLNAGQAVVRYYNVRETSGNVFRLWESIPEPEPIPWTDCRRYFISLEAAIRLTVRAADLPPGRYVAPAETRHPEHMRDVARALYPHRDLVEIPRRRGDRQQEPRCARSESMVMIGAPGIVRVVSAHDPVRVEAIAA